MLEWANEELAVFQGQLAFLKLGSVRICTVSRRARELPTDVTDDYVALIEDYRGMDGANGASQHSRTVADT